MLELICGQSGTTWYNREGFQGWGLEHLCSRIAMVVLGDLGLGARTVGVMAWTPIRLVLCSFGCLDDFDITVMVEDNLALLLSFCNKSR